MTDAAPLLPAELIQQLAGVDPDRMLATGFAAAGARAHLIALIAFNAELARAREAVREPGLGAIRLQWWREVLDECCGGGPVRRHPVALALAATVQACGLPRSLLEALVDVREAEFEEQPFDSLEAVEAWLDRGPGNLVRLSLLGCGLPALSGEADRLARAAGVAWGLAGLMRALPWWAARGASWLPAPWIAEGELAQVALVPQQLGAGLDAGLRRQLLEPVAHRVRALHREARSLARAVPPDTLAAFAYVTLAPALARRALRGETRPGLLLLRQLQLVTAVALQRP
jgi:phytoene/squalene synthetase